MHRLSPCLRSRRPRAVYVERQTHQQNNLFSRFVVDETHPESQRPLGAIHALCCLRDEGALQPQELARADQIVAWLASNLATPVRFRRSRSPRAPRRAVSWFKTSAAEHILLMREVTAILERHGIRVRILTTSKPGYVVHEDQHQVVTEPFADTGA